VVDGKEFDVYTSRDYYDASTEDHAERDAARRAVETAAQRTGVIPDVTDGSGTKCRCSTTMR
jgi:hypothetical protein